MTKALIIFFLWVISIATTLGQDTLTTDQNGANKTPIVFNTTKKNFGSIEVDSKATFTFELTNESDNPLIIWNVTTSCGCTTPSWTKNPIKKGKKGEVKVKYDSSKPGKFEKSIFVYTNFSDKPSVLKIEGTVLEKPAPINKSKAGFTKSPVQMEPTLNSSSKK